MDLVINYPEFKTNILTAFDDIIEKWNFDFSIVFEGRYELKSKLCTLRFTYDRGDIGCDIKKPGQDNVCQSVSSVFRYLYPNSDEPITKDLQNPYLQLIAIAEIVRKYLTNILEGDFSWYEGYIEQEKKLNKMIGYVWEKIDRNSELYKKFRSGDKSWMDDLEIHLRKNNVKL